LIASNLPGNFQSALRFRRRRSRTTSIIGFGVTAVRCNVNHLMWWWWWLWWSSSRLCGRLLATLCRRLDGFLHVIELAVRLRI
jgi:hypothetical protein